MKYAILLLVFFSIACADKNAKKDTPFPIQIESKFDPSEVAWFSKAGTGSIKGVAKFKSMPGDVLYGEAYRIELNAYSKYAEERLQHIYKHRDNGFVYTEDGIMTFTPDPEGYHNTRKTMCNANGEFEFTNLPPGEYYVIAFMIKEDTGGGIMKRITLSDNETKTVDMVNF